MGMMVNSHIQMPKQVMKNFTNKNGQLFYYDHEGNVIHSGHPKTLYTEKGYYSDDVEKFLGTEIESDLGKLIKFLKDAEFETGKNPPMQYKNIAFNYVYSLIVRSPSFQKELYHNSIFFRLCDVKREQNDIAVYYGFLMAKRIKLMNQYKISFLDNKTPEEFVLPTGGMTQITNKIICPVTPKRAIVLDDINTEKAKKNNVVVVYEIYNQEVLHLINKMSFVQERQRDKKFVISGEKSFLQRICDEINRM